MAKFKAFKQQLEGSYRKQQRFKKVLKKIKKIPNPR